MKTLFIAFCLMVGAAFGQTRTIQPNTGIANGTSLAQFHVNTIEPSNYIFADTCAGSQEIRLQGGIVLARCVDGKWREGAPDGSGTITEPSLDGRVSDYADTIRCSTCKSVYSSGEEPDPVPDCGPVATGRLCRLKGPPDVAAIQVKDDQSFFGACEKGATPDAGQYCLIPRWTCEDGDRILQISVNGKRHICHNDQSQ